MVITIKGGRKDVINHLNLRVPFAQLCDRFANKFVESIYNMLKIGMNKESTVSDLFKDLQCHVFPPLDVSLGNPENHKCTFRG